MSDVNNNSHQTQSNEVLATVKGVQGRVVVERSNGEVQYVKSGGKLELGDVIQTKGGSVAVLDFGGAGLVTIGHDQELSLDDRLLKLLKEAEELGSLDEGINFDLIAQALEEGRSLEEVLPAAAAGEEQGPNADGTASSGAVQLQFTAEEVTPEAGFDTSGLSRSNLTSELPDGRQLDQDFLLNARNAQPETTGINAVAVDEDVSFNIDLSESFSDADADQSLTYVVEGLPAGLTYDPQTGQITGTPTNDDALTNNGSYTVTVTASDGSGADNGSVTTTFALQVQNVNDQPTIDAAIDLGASDEDVAMQFTPAQLLVGSEDIDLDTLSVANVIVSEGQGTVSQDENGNFIFMPDPNWNGPVQLVYDVIDGNGGSVSNVASLVVSPVNDAPVAVQDGPIPTTTNTSVDLNVLANDSDIDGDILTVVSASAENGTVQIGPNGVVAYTPDENFFGDDIVSYQISDGQGGVAESSAQVSVLYNAGTVAINNIDVTDDATPIFSGVSSNIEGDLSLVINGNTFMVTPADDGSWSYELPPEFALADGSYEVSVTGLDNIGNEAVASDSFIVDALMPEVSIVDLEVSATETPTFSGLSNNTDGDFTLIVNGVSYTVTPSENGSWSYTLPASDALSDGEYTAEIQVSDANGNMASASDDFSVDALAPAVSIADLEVATSPLPTFSGTSQNTDGDLTLTVNDIDYIVTPEPDGSWSYTLPSGSELSDGSYIATIRGTDNQGNAAASSDAFVVDAVDDAPIVTGEFTGVTVEGDLGDISEASGTINIEDPDVGANPSFENTTVAGTYGTLVLDSGVWTYTLDQSTVQNLDAGDVISEMLTLTATDGTVQNIEVSITGTEDAPIVSGNFVGSVLEANLGDISTVSGVLNIADVDDGDMPVFADNIIPGTYGSLELVAGAWTYTLDQASVQNLDAGEVISDMLTLTATDGTLQNIEISITGTDDAPVVSGDFVGSVTEANIGDVVTATGSLSIADVDDGDTPTFEDTVIAGTYGSLELVAGAWTYTLDQATVQNLNAGEVISDTLTLTATDGTLQNIEISITGTDDAPVVSGDFVGSVTEANIGDVVTATGSLSIADVDDGDTPTFADTVIAGSYGSLELVAGAWTYTLDQASVQNLDAGEVISDTLTLTATDGTVQNIEISITGTDDAPVVSGDFVGSVTEANIGDVVTATGSLSIADVDDGDTPTFADTVIAGAYGSLELVAGAWTYTLDQSSVQNLNVGDTLQDIITLTASDGTEQTVTIAIEGTNDAPVVSGDFVGSVTEANIGDTSTVSGVLNITDVDDGDTPTFADTVIAGTYGSLELVAGEWTYTLDQATVQNLDAGEVISDTLTLTATDGTLQNIEISITGTDDAPVVSGDFVGSVTEANIGDVVTATGSLSIADVDDGDTPTFADTVIAGAYGSLELVAGAWTYTLDQSSVQNLNVGDTLQDIITLTASDGTEQTVTIAIEGTNDAPVVSGDFVGSVTEANIGDTSTVSGVLNITDVDDGDTPTFADTVIAGTYGSLELVAGEWTYTLDQATVQNLDAGEVISDTLTLTATDGTVQNIEISITGTDDAPVVSGDFVGSVTEANIGDTSTVSGVLNITDVDDGDTPTFADTVIAGTYGSLELVAGEWTYTLDQATVQNLDAGEVISDTLTLTATDGTVQNIEISITGTDDAPVVSGDFVGSVTEANIGDVVTATGSLSIADVDDGDTPTFEDTVIAGTYGSLELVAGAWTYTLDQATVQNLNAGEVISDTLSLTATDGTVQNIEISITGTDDAPVVSGDFVGSVTEANVGDTSTVSGVLNITDVDDGDTPTFADTVIAGSYGSLELVAGAWTYTLDQSSVQNLNVGDTLQDIITLTASDGTEQTVTIAIEGTNDAPVVSGDFVGSVTEANIGDTSTVSGVLNITDVDDGDTPTFADTVIAGTYGSLELVAGAWTYTLDQSSVQNLNVGDTLQDIITLTASDGTEQTLTIAIEGTNDVPVVSEDAQTINENAILSGSVPPATDVDGEIENYTLVQDVGEGSLTFDPDSGDYIFTPGTDFDDLAEGASRDVTFTYTATDDQGGVSAPATVTITVSNSATADAPLLTLGGGDSVLANLVSGSGLTLSVFSSVPFTRDDVRESAANLENEFLEATPDSQSIITTVTDDSNTDGRITIQEGTAIQVTGFVFLEADRTYEISGYRDDTFHIELGGAVLYDQGYNHWGTYNETSDERDPNSSNYTNVAETFTPSESGFYSVEMTVFNGDGRGDFSAFMSVDGGAAQDFSEFLLYANADELASSGAPVSDFIGGSDGGYFPFEANSGITNGEIRLQAISAELTDTDGSETLSLVISDIPVGAVLSDGVSTFTSTAGLTSVDVSSWQTDALTILAPTDFTGVFTLVATATSTETANGDTASVSESFDVSVFDIALTDAADIQIFTNSTADFSLDTDVITGINGLDGTALVSGVAGDATYDSGVQQINVAGSSFQYDLISGYGVESATGDVSVDTTATGDTTIDGSASDDLLLDLSGGDTLLIGSAGNDHLSGGSGSDTFGWQDGDQGTVTDVARDTVVDFAAGAGGDTLDFSDLLQGESSDALTLDAYLDFSSDGTDTTISIDRDGGSGVTQEVVLSGVDLTLIGNDQAIIQQLLTDGNLATD